MRARLCFQQSSHCSVFGLAVSFALFGLLWSFGLNTAGHTASKVDTGSVPNEPKTSITIGFLTSFKSGVGKIIAGAIPLAIEYVNK